MRFCIVFLLATAALPLHADILHLRNGQRLYGEIVSQTEREVVFRVRAANGLSGVQKFAAESVVRVERTPIDRPPEEADRGAATTRPAEDFEQMLREAFELLDDGDHGAALRAMQHVVTRASPAELEQLSEQSRNTRGAPLDELLAETRISALLRDRRGLRVRYATPFEAAALGRALERRQDAALSATYSGRPIVQWLRTPDEYEELQPDSRQLVAEARIAAGAIGGRLRYDRRLRLDRLERQRLVELRADISRFVAKIMALKGFTTLEGEEAELDVDETDDAPLPPEPASEPKP